MPQTPAHARRTAHQHRRPRTWRDALRIGVMLALLATLGVISPQVASTAATISPSVSTGTDPANGFPLWYQDSTGVRVAPCLDVADANCIVTADAGYDPARPLAFPTNFPSEFFYAQAESTKLATPGCKGSKAGRVYVGLALEGAFANGAPAYGDQMVFGRTRLTLTSGLCPKSTYTVVQPYGTFTFTTDDKGALAKNQATTDVGCAPIAPNVCDFRLALNSTNAKSFLRWDPAVAPQAPNGYLGDGTTLHRVTGGTYVPTGATAPVNYFQLAGPGLNAPLRTDTFSVMGKQAGPLSATPAGLDFAGQPAGTTSAARNVTVTSLAVSNVTAGAATLTGPNAADFAITGNGCLNQVLVQDTSSCAVSVQFKPGVTATGPRSAQLVLAHNSFGRPLTVPLAGTATAAAAAPAIATSVSSIDFGQQRIRYSTTSRTITVTSNGTAPLVVSGVAVNGGASGEFTATNHCLDPVAPGSTCTITADFSPTTVGVRSTTLKITSNASASTTDIPLTGTGAGGVAAVSPTKESNGFPSWYQDERGVRMLQCIDPDDPNCLVLPGGTFAGVTPLSFPDNFPDEFFWWIADSDILTTPGCNGSAPGKALFRFVMEGAFANGNPAPGDQMAFGRIRIRSTGGLCPNTTYTVVHPYGTQEVTTDADGGLKPAPNTSDVGCAPVAGGDPCDFSLALRSPVAGGFLRWDPAVAPAAPAGYVGNPTVLHTVVGAPYTPSGSSAPANYVAIYQGTQLVARTDKFNVMGKLGGPLVADPVAASFDPLAVGAPPASTTITLANTGIAPLTVNGFSLAGAAAASYAMGANTCTSALAPGATCAVQVSFAPVDQGTQKAQLVVNHTGLNSPMNVALSGVGLAPEGTAALSVDRASLAFAQLHSGRTSPARTVVVSNVGGTAPLMLGNITVTGSGASSYAVSPGTCTGPVAVGASCALEVRFAPTGNGAQPATLVVNAPLAAPTSRQVTLSGTGFTGTRAVATTTRLDGYPTYYQDQNGVRVSPCIEAADPNCVVLADAGFDPAQPLAFPGNYPGEFFYALADSEPATVTDDSCGASTDLFLRAAVEGSFANGSPEPGQQITFGRTRIVMKAGGALCPSTDYTFVTPFGEQHFTTDATGGLKRTAGTIDIGCGAAPCNFGDAVASPVLDGFLRWAPGVGADAPDGYLGDGVTFHPVVGGTYLVPGTTEPVNYFEVKNGATTVGRSTRFATMGRVASGMAAGDAAVFGDVPTGASTTRAVTFTNVGTQPVTVASARVTGSAAFSVASTTCTGAPVAGGASCTVSVRFAPTTAGPASGTVEIVGTPGFALAGAGLAGNGTVVVSPQIAVTPASIAFPATRVGTPSAGVAVTVRNSGTGTLSLQAPVLGGANPGDFVVTTPAGCATVTAGATCTVTVQLRPTAAGNRTATLTLPSNAPGTAPTVTLSGTGTASAIQSKAATLDLGTQAIGRTTTKSFLITNSGTAPLTITGVTLASGVDFTADRGSCTAAVAPGKTCSINVTFTARAPAGAKSTTLGFVSDAPTAVNLPVTGAAK